MAKKDVLIKLINSDILEHYYNDVFKSIESEFLIASVKGIINKDDSDLDFIYSLDKKTKLELCIYFDMQDIRRRKGKKFIYTNEFVTYPRKYTKGYNGNYMWSLD